MPPPARPLPERHDHYHHQHPGPATALSSSLTPCLVASLDLQLGLLKSIEWQHSNGSWSHDKSHLLVSAQPFPICLPLCGVRAAPDVDSSTCIPLAPAPPSMLYPLSSKHEICLCNAAADREFLVDMLHILWLFYTHYANSRKPFVDRRD
jgi:hypothetical protein